MKSGEISTYEQQRLEIIKQNQAVFQSLGIDELVNAQTLTNEKNTKAKVKGKKAADSHKRKASTEDVIPSRRSSRLQGSEPEKTMATSKGTIYLDPESESRKAKEIGEVAFEAHDVAPEENVQYLDNMLKDIPEEQKHKTSNKSVKEEEIKRKINKVKLEETDVCKMSKERIMVIGFHPTVSKRIVITGNKIGEVALWDVDRPYRESEDHLVSMIYPVHNKPLSCVVVNPFNHHQLYTSDYDGCASRMDFTTRKVDRYFSNRDYNITSSIPSRTKKDIVYIGDSDGDFLICDLRLRSSKDNAVASELTLHDRKIGCVDSHPTKEYMIATSSLDRTSCIWDLRNTKKGMKPLQTLTHSKAVSSVFFSPSGNKVITTSNDDTVKVWDNLYNNKDKLQCQVTKHNNQTGRWITNFKAKFIGEDLWHIGNMKRFVDIYSCGGTLERQLSSPYMTAIPSVNDYHSQFQELAAGTNGRVHIFR